MDSMNAMFAMSSLNHLWIFSRRLHMKLLQPRNEVKPSKIGDLLIYERQKRNTCFSWIFWAATPANESDSRVDKRSQFIIPFEFLVSSCGIWLETCFKWSFYRVSNRVPNRPTDTEHCTLSADRANNTPLAPPDNGLSLEHSTGLFSEECLLRFCSLNLDHFSGLRDYASCLSTLCFYP